MGGQQAVRSDSTLEPTRTWWDELATAVADFDPGVVVLVARKAPRVAQALTLQFGHNPLVISDLALPLSTDALKGARVAIVDDVVNVGTTLARARDTVLEAGASEVKVFAVSRVACQESHDILEGAVIINPRPLDKQGLDAFAARIPLQLQRIARPYDLDFPLIRCHLPRQREGFADLADGLREQFGEAAVYDLSTAVGAEHGIWRLAVDPPGPDGWHHKLRMYVDEATGYCVLVPIRIASPMRTDAPGATWAGAAWREIVGETEDVESRGRARMFIDSLAFGLRFVATQGSLLKVDPKRPFDLDEAELVLGPRVRRAARHLSDWPAKLAETDDWAQASAAQVQRSPFFASIAEAGLLEELEEAESPLTALVTFFAALAEWVGAADPTEYRLTYPHTPEEILEDPYQRLRIGPTITDLVAIVSRLTGSEDELQLREQVTRLLDRFIDGGGVVPTTAVYDGKLYRIYRKGEKDPRDEVSRRTRRAWTEYGKALSLTRLTKLGTILAYTEDRGESTVVVKANRRGSVLCYAPSVLHDEAEVAHHLLRTGQLNRS